MIKEKEKGGGARLKDEPNDPAEPGHGSRPPSASLPTPAALKKEPDEPPHRVKMEPHSQSNEDSAAELGVDGIKTEIDGLMDSDGDPTKSPSCELGGPGSLKSERLSSDSNDILDPQTGLRGSSGNLQDGNQNCRNPNVGPDMGSCRMGGGGGPMGPGVSMGPMSASEAQTLPSNVISKQAGSMEQQSQIFVFSTLLANKGAEAVLSGQHHSIIAYHCAQPGTKKYLEKHPLKMGQFNKQNPAQWLNNLAMAKSRGGMRGGPNMMGGPNQMGHMMGGPMGGNMGPMGHGMGHMGPNMMGPNRMGAPNQMMMMKGGPGQMGQMGPGMAPMDGFPGGTPSCGVMDGLGADGEMPWDTKNPSVMSNGMANGPQMPACSESGPASDSGPGPAGDNSSSEPCQTGPKATTGTGYESDREEWKTSRSQFSTTAFDSLARPTKIAMALTLKKPQRLDPVPQYYRLPSETKLTPISFRPNNFLQRPPRLPRPNTEMKRNFLNTDHRKFTSLQSLELPKKLSEPKRQNDVKKTNYSNISNRITGLTNKLRDLGNPSNTIGRFKAQSHGDVANLKPVLKTNAQDGGKRSVVRTCSAEPPKKVTFSAFATVQVV